MKKTDNNSTQLYISGDVKEVLKNLRDRMLGSYASEVPISKFARRLMAERMTQLANDGVDYVKVFEKED